MLKGDFPYSSSELTLFAASPLRRSRPPPLQHFAIQRRVSRVYLTGARRGGTGQSPVYRMVEETDFTTVNPDK